MSLFGSGRLLTTNATIDVQTYAITQNDAGATVETYTTTIPNVSVLFTQHGASRTEEFNTDAQRRTGTITTGGDVLLLENTRFVVTGFADRRNLVGTYWRVVSINSHPSGRGGILPARVECQVEQLNLPGKVS